ncbi:HupE/UreJ family protein [Zobellia sp. 1_MG-2023]|uniref:HupE/UreJ family protein n=1 Tax=Zobellia sp. 1_MG-2023 TaxID=3062626 RepID=UPI0026E2F51B|nr:HupE/UreJ family protein [Zobellia sp. 1_MG-2023]MDO6818292.1 HupE/UreJ family protein [Zobellia sp. 1_MG-2023]
MEEFLFYIKMGLEHVLDINAYDHILFLAALAVPFSFKTWKKVVLLATVFTIAHCVSLALSAYGWVNIDVSLIEFLIPVTIMMTAVFNLLYMRKAATVKSMQGHVLATLVFGLIHGFGFSNYFRMLMAEEDNKLVPLLGFATGIEISQVTIVASVLVLGWALTTVTKLSKVLFVVITSILIILLTIPMLIRTFPL